MGSECIGLLDVGSDVARCDRENFGNGADAADSGRPCFMPVRWRKPLDYPLVIVKPCYHPDIDLACFKPVYQA